MFTHLVEKNSGAFSVRRLLPFYFFGFIFFFNCKRNVCLLEFTSIESTSYVRREKIVDIVSLVEFIGCNWLQYPGDSNEKETT